MRWSLNGILDATGGTLGGAAADRRMADAPVQMGFAIDSRRLTAGEVFVAIRAERDGHDFVEAAVEAGAASVVIERSGAASPRVPAVVVPDTTQALLDIGRASRRRLAGTVIGITGSVGKTSTKDLAVAAIAAERRTVGSERSFNNDLGVPLTLANAPADTEVAVVEMGARGPGHISRLAEVARPTIGIVTAVAAAHTEMFGDLDGVALAKGELVEALPERGTAILNADDPRVLSMRSRTTAAVITYGATEPNADVVAVKAQLDEMLRPRFVVESPWGSSAVRLEARGLHQVGNALAAIAAACTCGVKLDAATGALGEAQLSPWRMELARAQSGAWVLNDAYNANPASTSAALQALADLEASRRVAVLGVMAELGVAGESEHRRAADLAASLGIDVIAVGTSWYGPEVQSVAGVDQAAALLSDIGEGDAILVKGSRVAGLERLAALLLGAGDARG